MSRFWKRITQSQRQESFNPLSWPFLAATASYGVGFVYFALSPNETVSSLWAAMVSIHPWVPLIWGVVAVLTIVGGLTFLLWNIPPAGKISGLVGFMLWVFASWCYILTGGWLLLFAVALPNAFFWVWQYLSLSLFRREDAEDVATMEAYDAGRYDDRTNPDAVEQRESNRGLDDESPDVVE